ncbi:type VI secretion system Vgr family protein [Pseudomonas paraeruginosa]|uniref:Type VI secretion system tip protein VgrG n=1 Tax=Pseudomonas aeruginosa TaxID=287 RepID=A0ABD7JYU2_PSEAI|nr:MULTISPECIES: type VI secretion system tip protein TssI/VgrG [Pseudomonas aeruginosa group]KFF32171.1 type VI secretion protein VgrG [Pseudomonas aeruginosa VRFPA01]KFF33009.1 type VI secretion protein VgrG [Pseudomonas aeruginosa VRFPA01]RTR93285.1 type VI secretion system tip protein VgrG [Pseudomonas paraeruginosa]RTS42291.1 type VI secretion system tip protein VgrG [Pseudomonas aeruginosa]
MPHQADLRFTFRMVDGMEFEVIEFTLDEALSETFRLELDLASPDPAVDFAQVLDRPALFTLWRGEQPVRYVHGLVSTLEQGETGFRRTRYRAVVEPELARLKQSSDWRVFQTQHVPDILQSVLKRHGILHYEQIVTGEHLPREYCVQAGDTDYDFLERIAREEGFYYTFLHSADGHQLIHSDRLFVQGRIGDEPVLYNADIGGDQAEPALRRFRYVENVRTARQTQRDYLFTHPGYNQEHSLLGSDVQRDPRRPYERYDYPGRYKADEAGKPFTENRLRGHRRDARVALVEGDDPRLMPGISFDLSGHPRQEWNSGWRPVRMRHHGVQHTSQAEEGAGSDQGTRYHYTAELVTDRTEWRAEPLPKPRIDGTQPATVVGPPDEEIYCDEWGRVKIQFPWDRLGRFDDHSSCWVRAVQNWAGAAWGHMAIPRIGQEVLVVFMNGDPDQPIIVGRTYMATQPPPYELPRHKTRMTIKSQTHKGQGSNELRFEDEAGQEEVYLHAQKDQNIHVNHDETISIGNDQAIGVVRDRTTNIGRDEVHTTSRDRKEHILQDVFSTIDRNEIRKVGNTLKESIAASHLVDIGENQTVIIEGVQSIESRTALRTLTKTHVLQGTERILIRGPNGKVILDASGITLDGPNIFLKGNVKVLSPSGAQSQAIEAAIRDGSPLIEECPLAKDFAS